jgi:hypothetical protein
MLTLLVVILASQPAIANPSKPQSQTTESTGWIENRLRDVGAYVIIKQWSRSGENLIANKLECIHAAGAPEPLVMLDHLSPYIQDEKNKQKLATVKERLAEPAKINFSACLRAWEGFRNSRAEQTQSEPGENI